MSGINNEQNINISKSKNVQVGNVSNVTNLNQGNGVDDAQKVFELLLEKINGLKDEEDKQDARNAVQALEAEAKKQGQTSEKSVKKWFRFLMETAPDIGQVAIDTFINPIKGISTVFQKVAERARAERLAEEKANEEQQ